MKLAKLFQSVARPAVLLAMALAFSAGVNGLTVAAADAQTAGSAAQDCANAVIWCGVSSMNELAQRYNNGDGHNTAASIQHIYAYFGISNADITAMQNNSLQVMAGSVTRTGDVYNDNGKLVATSAVTGGRQNIAGSTAVVTGGTKFYVRPPGVSFRQSRLRAFVVMNNGRFDFAIITSCGNAVKATPVAAKPAPKPMVTTTKPKPTPPAPPPAARTRTVNTNICSGNATSSATANSASGSGNCNTTLVRTQTNNTTTNTTTAPPALATTSPSPPEETSPPATTSSAPTSLVNTGPGSVAAVFGSAALIGGAAYLWRLRRVIGR